MTRRIKEPLTELLHFDFEGVDKCLVQRFQNYTLLRKLEIAPLFQGHGIGSQVLQELKRQHRTIRLIPYPDDPNRYGDLIRFYQSNGFEWDETQDTMVWSP